METNKNVKSFGQFNENSDISNIEKFRSAYPGVKVKDLVSFLQKFDPESPVILDKDGWPNELWGDEYSNLTPEEKIKKSGLIDDSAITHRGGNYIIINN